MRALVTGATGFIGRRLVSLMNRPVVLSRDPARARASLGEVEALKWDAISLPPPAAFEGVDAVFHLAGESIAGGRWTAARKKSIHDSRVIGTRHLVAAIESAKQKPSVLVSASAIGLYGDRGDEILDETSAPGTDFLAHTCVMWEKEARKAELAGVRVVTPRLGLVLGGEGGALPKMLTPFRLGVGGRLGHGRQWMSWIAADDVVELLRFVATNQIRGAVNAVAPQPVRNIEFTRSLARVLGRPAILPAPAAALKLVLGEMAEALLLSSQRVMPRAAAAAGFKFRHDSLPDALHAALGKAA